MRVVTTVVCLFFGAFLYFGSQSNTSSISTFNHQKTTESMTTRDYIQKSVEDMNRTLPKYLDSYTTWESVRLYKNKLMHIVKVDHEALYYSDFNSTIAQQKAEYTRLLCSGNNQLFELFIKENILITYTYYHKNNKLWGEIVIDPKDCELIHNP